MQRAREGAPAQQLARGGLLLHEFAQRVRDLAEELPGLRRPGIGLDEASSVSGLGVFMVSRYAAHSVLPIGAL